MNDGKSSVYVCVCACACVCVCEETHYHCSVIASICEFVIFCLAPPPARGYVIVQNSKCKISNHLSRFSRQTRFFGVTIDKELDFNSDVLAICERDPPTRVCCCPSYCMY